MPEGKPGKTYEANQKTPISIPNHPFFNCDMTNQIAIKHMHVGEKEVEIGLTLPLCAKKYSYVVFNILITTLKIDAAIANLVRTKLKNMRTIPKRCKSKKSFLFFLTLNPPTGTY